MSTARDLLFVHANGFAPGAYRQLLDPVAAAFTIHAAQLAPLRPGTVPTRCWHRLAHEVGAQADALGRPVIGLGHSLGAVALLLSAAARPDRYSHLYLIEPPTLPGWITTLLQHAPASIRRRGALARRARARVDRWPSVDEAYRAERARRWLARVPDPVLRDIVESALQPDRGGVTLRYSKEWEATLYESPANVWPALRAALPPITALRGAGSTVFDRRAFARWRRRRPADRLIEIADTGHLLPLERPDAVAQIVLQQADLAPA